MKFQTMKWLTGCSILHLLKSFIPSGLSPGMHSIFNMSICPPGTQTQLNSLFYETGGTETNHVFSIGQNIKKQALIAFTILGTKSKSYTNSSRTVLGKAGLGPYKIYGIKSTKKWHSCKRHDSQQCFSSHEKCCACVLYCCEYKHCKQNLEIDQFHHLFIQTLA